MLVTRDDHLSPEPGSRPPLGELLELPNVPGRRERARCAIGASVEEADYLLFEGTAFLGSGKTPSSFQKISRALQRHFTSSTVFVPARHVEPIALSDSLHLFLDIHQHERLSCFVDRQETRH